jgi:hypothetical protein
MLASMLLAHHCRATTHTLRRAHLLQANEALRDPSLAVIFLKSPPHVKALFVAGAAGLVVAAVVAGPVVATTLTTAASTGLSYLKKLMRPSTVAADAATAAAAAAAAAAGTAALAAFVAKLPELSDGVDKLRKETESSGRSFLHYLEQLLARLGENLVKAVLALVFLVVVTNRLLSAIGL